MYDYKAVGFMKMGRKNMYVLQSLNNGVNKMAGTAEVKELALNDKISNLVWKGKLVEIPDRV